MSDLNIFDSAAPQGGEFFKFSKVGDAIQGTYVDKKSGTDGYGNTQTIYVLKDSDGKIWNLGFKETSFIVHERMDGIRMGQIVGFKFDEERESKKNPGMNKAKIIRVYADPKFVDAEWLAEQKHLKEMFGDAPVAPATTKATSSFDDIAEDDTEDVPFNSAGDQAGSQQAVVEKPSNAQVDLVISLARGKGLVKAAHSDDEAVSIIEDFCGVEISNENYTKIVIKLSEFNGK